MPLLLVAIGDAASTRGDSGLGDERAALEREWPCTTRVLIGDGTRCDGDNDDEEAAAA